MHLPFMCLDIEMLLRDKQSSLLFIKQINDCPQCLTYISQKKKSSGPLTFIATVV